MICLISDQSNEPTKNLKSLNRLIENRNSKLYTKWLKRAETLRVELCRLMKLEQVPPLPLLLSKPTSPLFNWKDPYWQCLITIQWTQSRYEGSLRSSVSAAEKELRNLENYRLLPDSAALAEVRWCGVTVRLGEFMYQIMESPAITQMTLNGREIWLIVVLYIVA